MIQSKAIDIIKELNKKEFIQFGKYLESAAFTSNKKLIKLYNFLKRYYPAFSSEKLSKETVFRSVYGNTGYNDAKARKLLSDIYKEAERFIVILNALTHRETYDKILLEEFDVRKLDSLFESKYEEYNTYLDGGEKHYQYFLEKYLVEWRNIIFNLERGMQFKIAMNVYKRSDYLIFFFLSDLFLTLCDIEANKQAYNVESKVNLTQAFISNLNEKKLLDYIEKNNFENKDVLFSYYLGYQAVSNFNDEKHYYNLKDHVLKNIDRFHEGTQKSTVIFLLNYCTRKLRTQHHQKFKLELYDSYNLYIKYKLYKISDENYIRIDIFINILSNYFSVGKITEAAAFLENNIESIQPGHRKNMLALSNALIQFEKRNFGESLRNVSLIKSNTFLYKNSVKVLGLKNNFELKNYEIARQLSHNYRNYLIENKNINPAHREKDLMFLRYYSTLWKIYDGKSVRSTISELKKEVLENDRFPESDWILAKINELEAKK
jgi:hypothetical protein